LGGLQVVELDDAFFLPLRDEQRGPRVVGRGDLERDPVAECGRGERGGGDRPPPPPDESERQRHIHARSLPLHAVDVMQGTSPESPPSPGPSATGRRGRRWMRPAPVYYSSRGLPIGEISHGQGA